MTTYTPAIPGVNVFAPKQTTRPVKMCGKCVCLVKGKCVLTMNEKTLTDECNLDEIRRS